MNGHLSEALYQQIQHHYEKEKKRSLLQVLQTCLWTRVAPADVERDPRVHGAEWAPAPADLPRILRVDTEAASDPV